MRKEMLLKLFFVGSAFLLAASSLVAGLVVVPAAAAPSASSSVGSYAQRLIGARAPHTFTDFKGNWAGQEA